jgi:hypothetical protein
MEFRPIRRSIRTECISLGAMFPAFTRDDPGSQLVMLIKFAIRASLRTE